MSMKRHCSHRRPPVLVQGLPTLCPVGGVCPQPLPTSVPLIISQHPPPPTTHGLSLWELGPWYSCKFKAFCVTQAWVGSSAITYLQSLETFSFISMSFPHLSGRAQVALGIKRDHVCEVSSTVCGHDGCKQPVLLYLNHFPLPGRHCVVCQVSKMKKLLYLGVQYPVTGISMSISVTKYYNCSVRICVSLTLILFGDEIRYSRQGIGGVLWEFRGGHSSFWVRWLTRGPLTLVSRVCLLRVSQFSSFCTAACV